MKIALGLIVLSIALLFGCQAQTEKEAIRIGLLNGPSAMSFVGLLDSTALLNNRPIDVTIYPTPQDVVHRLIQKRLDIATLPLATAVNLYNKGVPIQIIGCAVWGSLFLLENSTADSTDSRKNRIGLFGKGTTPEIIARQTLSASGFADKPFNFVYSSPTELAQALCSGQIRYAVLPEPFATSALNRAASVSIVKDLAPQFPQTVVVIGEQLIAAPASRRESVDELLVEATEIFQTDSLSQAIELLLRQKLIPDTIRAEELIKRCRINYTPIASCRGEVENGIKLLFGHAPESLGGQLPDSALYSTDKK